MTEFWYWKQKKKQIDRKIVKMLENKETRDKLIDLLTDEGLL